MSNKSLLDALLGPNRDGGRAKSYKFTDDEVCKEFLVWQCFGDMFTNTKSDQGPCPKVHDISLRRKFEDACATYATERKAADPAFDEKREGDPWGLWYNMMSRIEDHVRKSDSIIREHYGRVDVMKELECDDETFKMLSEQARILKSQGEDLAEEGKLDECMMMLDTVAEVETKMRNIHAEVTAKKAGVPPPPPGVTLDATQALRSQGAAKLRPCESCGALLSLFDSSRRIADHMGGKLHIGYRRMRQKLEELRAMAPRPMHFHRSAFPKASAFKDLPAPRDSGYGDRDPYRARGEYGGGGGDGRKDREREQDRPRDRERDYHGRDRHDGRDRYEGRDRYDGRDRGRDGGRDGGRDRDRGRDDAERKRRSRSRSRSRDRR